jgi:predicted DCC family thiol-disulfide oxidoreductase YuxK
VLFDGNCRLCNASVDFVIRNDAAKRFVFAPQSSNAAKRLLSAVAAAGRPEPDGGGASAAVKSGTGRTGAEDSVIVITPDGTVHEQSDAALAVGRALTPPWWPPLAALGTALLPRAARDAAYAYVGRHRYAWFGKREGGRREWDPEEEDHRFLDRNERKRRGAALAGGGVAETASSRPSETPPSR